jgi:hypothetical protein
MKPFKNYTTMQENLVSSPLAEVGEAIDKELAAKMVKDFQDSHPKEITAYYIGRTIIEKILNQPNCVGIRFYNALNEIGEKTLVYIGVDENDELISEISIIDNSGCYRIKEGIVADRVVIKPNTNDDSTIFQGW